MTIAAIRPGLADQELAPGSAGSGRMPGGIALSATLHIGLLVLIVLGLPDFFRPPVPPEQPIAVDLVTIGPETHATHPNPHRPIPHAKPIPPSPAPPAPVPPPKPVPPEASAAPPPAAAAPPPPAAVEPPKPEIKPAPPPPPPKPEAVAIVPPPPPKPPVPQPKPAEPTQSPLAFDKLVKQLDKPQKPQPATFDSLLKNLTRNDTAETPDTPPQQRVRTAAAAAPSSQPHAPLGSQLSASEIDLIREQISRCWNVPAGARDAQDLVVEIHVIVNPDGTVQQATIVDQGRLAGDPTFRAAAESARRAFFNPACTPLRLPPDKYEVWKDLVVDFNPKDIL